MENEIITTTAEVLKTSTALYWILGVTGALLMLLLSIIGYFLKKNYKDRGEYECRLEDNYQAMKDMISTLDKTIGKLDALLDNFSKTTEKRLDSHSAQIHDHEKRIYVLER